MPGTAPALIAIPTAGRPRQLATALASITDQARAAGVRVVVLDDGPGTADDTRRVSEQHGAEYRAVTGGGGLNAARNQAFALGSEPLVIFLDDDVRADPDWLAALLAADAEQPPAVAALAGRIVAWLDPATAPRSCGGHGSWVTELDLGPDDQDVRHGWGANLAIRRDWLQRVGPFDEAGSGGGDEEQWLDRAAAEGARVRYVGGARVLHERTGEAASLRSLAAAARARGRELRRYETREQRAPSLGQELRTLAGCLAHVPAKRCPMGLVLAAHSLGRIEQLLSPQPPRARRGIDDFLSGRSGTVAGRRGQLLAASDRLLDLIRSPRTLAEQLRAGRVPPRRILTLTIARDPAAFAPTAARLAASRHHVDVTVEPIDARGKFERLNAMLAEHDLAAYDHVLLVDDDVELPRGFTDRLIWAAERHGLLLAQPAHRRHSHAAWPVTRRRLGSAARRTHFVEIGPVTLLRGEALRALLPFPSDAPMGWGLDVHWGAVARERGWPIGIVDSTALLHTTPVAAGYDSAAPVAAARRFLAGKPYVTRDEAAWSQPAPTLPAARHRSGEATDHRRAEQEPAPAAAKDAA